MIDVQNLTVKYEDYSAVDNISFSVKSGSITGIIGPNGAGKSTLIRALVGLNMTYTGRIAYDARVLGKNRQWLKKRLGYAPEDADFLPYLSGREYLEMMAAVYKVKMPAQRIRSFLEIAGLSEKQNELILNYSHGMRQKISLLTALIGRPDFIIVDEAMNGMDPVSLFKLKNYLRRLADEGKVILVTSHIIPMIQQWCDPILIMNKGKLIKKYSQEDIQKIEQQTGSGFEEHFVKLVS